jgi:hypothetical protein
MAYWSEPANISHPGGELVERDQGFYVVPASSELVVGRGLHESNRDATLVGPLVRL